MGILVKDTRAQGVVHAEAPELQRKLRLGDGVIWSGDPRLTLIMRVVKNPATGALGRRYEVWRECEDGEDRMIGHWRLEEFDRILLDVARMRAAVDRPSEHQGVEQRIDEHNARLEREQREAYVERNFDFMDHYVRLWHDRNQGRNRFRQVGNPDVDKNGAPVKRGS